MKKYIIFLLALALFSCKKKDEPLPKNCFLRVNVTCNTPGANKVSGVIVYRSTEDYKADKNHVVQLTPTDSTGVLVLSGLEPLNFYLSVWNYGNYIETNKTPIYTPKLVSGDTIRVDVVLPD